HQSCCGGGQKWNNSFGWLHQAQCSNCQSIENPASFHCRCEEPDRPAVSDCACNRSLTRLSRNVNPQESPRLFARPSRVARGHEATYEASSRSVAPLRVSATRRVRLP